MNIGKKKYRHLGKLEWDWVNGKIKINEIEYGLYFDEFLGETIKIFDRGYNTLSLLLLKRV